ncbi:MAG: metal-sensing transcriptional repressor [Oscillospiraceae bacterium]|nr:metal-sensing transcriptional repressor [Oscillospiraceae bacterium]
MKADREQITRLVKTARGQLDGVLRMVEEDRYCIDVANQLAAAEAVLRRASREVLRAHMAACVTEAVTSGNAEEKINELTELFDRMTK